MLQCKHIAGLRQRLAEWRRAGDRIAFVPTMGNLHAGHLALVEHARQNADRVVVSIFVNPLQFGPGEDLDSYPRTLAEDAEKLSQLGADMLFSPSVAEMYPGGQALATRIEVPGVSEGLCGEHRPGHFVGVATVVAKLFNIVQPDVAVFGEKDYQQLMVIRKMVADLCLPVTILGMATRREADGLAMSSRNQYLSVAERQQAAGLYRCLQQLAADLRAGCSVEDSIAAGLKALESAGFEPEYLELREAESLSPASAASGDVVILAAAKLGKTRLIDNLRLSLVK